MAIWAKLAKLVNHTHALRLVWSFWSVWRIWDKWSNGGRTWNPEVLTKTKLKVTTVLTKFTRVRPRLRHYLRFTLLKFKSSTRQVKLLLPFGTKVLACFHSRQLDISFHIALDVVNLLQNTVRLRTSPMSPPCCFNRWRKIDVLPQPASPTSKTGFPASLNRPTKCEMRCGDKKRKALDQLVSTNACQCNIQDVPP